MTRDINQVPFPAHFRAKVIQKLPMRNEEVFQAFTFRIHLVKKCLEKHATYCHETRELLNEFNRIAEDYFARIK